MFGLKKWFLTQYNNMSDGSFRSLNSSELLTSTEPKNLCLEIIERETDYFWGHFLQYLVTLFMVAFVVFYMMTENAKVIRAAIIVSLLLTPQILRVQYRIRHINRAIKSFGEEKWLEVRYFVDAHYYLHIANPRNRKIEDWIMDSLKSQKWLKKLKIEENRITASTKYRFLGGSERIEIEWNALKTLKPETEIRISSYPKARRKSIDFGKNKVNVLLIYLSLMTQNASLPREESLKSFAPVGNAS